MHLTDREWWGLVPFAGALTGLYSLRVWFVVWILLHLVYRNKPYETRRALTIAFILIGLGVIGTFPTFFQMFG